MAAGGAKVDVLALFAEAGPVVLGVVVVLAISSVWCWAIVFQCYFRLARLTRAISASRHQRGKLPPLLDDIMSEGRRAAAESYAGESADARRGRIEATMRRRVQETIERAQGGLANLAVISSVAPFVGLFGTVWGIMTSFIGIASAQDTSLAVVAPGIAEALAATAIGLAAAIPAAFFYNRLAAGYTKAGRALLRTVEDRAPEVVYAEQPGGGG